MLTLWIVALTGWLLAAAALLMLRGLSRRLADLTDQYWALKFAHGELKARVDDLDPATPPRQAATPAPSGAFVPLSQVKR
ncbi:MAG: hypothetical protein AB7H88_14745 [Vicinamibacterales bacterium]